MFTSDNMASATSPQIPLTTLVENQSVGHKETRSTQIDRIREQYLDAEAIQRMIDDGCPNTQ